MGEIGHGYGSEWHLLRYLGRHRLALNECVQKATGGEAIYWLDFPFDPGSRWHDAEWEHLDFLPDNKVKEEWKRFWPQTGEGQNWDAVGRQRVNGVEEWFLVEAKAHEEEIFSATAAKTNGGLPTIQKALLQTMKALNVAGPDGHLPVWLNRYYQYANRLAGLHFLTSQQVPARLLCIYFCGDTFNGRKCPKAAEQWKAILEKAHAELGIDPSQGLMKRVHHLFLPVCQ